MVVVQKYGGSSVADVEKLRDVARRVKARKDEGAEVVVVVSAMGDTTDELLGLAKQVSADPPRRELDMLLTCGERISMALLSMALHELGVPAISFTGSQSGIITDATHAQARIVEVRPYRIQESLEAGKVVIVAGFQGVSTQREVTTLGRGGSDTTAVALAAALGGTCEIYSDVDGVFSADPRVVPEAKKLASLSYDEMQELAAAGAKVLNAQAVEFARARGITVHARSTRGGGTGSVVQASSVAAGPVKAVTCERELLVVEAQGPLEVLTPLLELLDASQVKGRLLASDGRGESSFLALPLQDVHGLPALRQTAQEKLGEGVSLREDLGSITCVGAGVSADGRILRAALALAKEQGVRVYAVHGSPLQLSMLVERSALDALTRALHHALVAA